MNRLTSHVLALCFPLLCMTSSRDACAQQPPSTLAKIQATNAVLIGYREMSVPFSYVDSYNQVVGFSQDLCNRVIDAIKVRTARPHLDVRFIAMTPQNRIAVMLNRTVDLECGVTTNDESRRQYVAFSHTFFLATTRLLTRKDSGIRDFTDLAGKTVVVNQGTTAERILRKMNEDKKMKMRIISAADHGEGRMTLETGRAVAYMMDDVLLVGTKLLMKHPSNWVIVGTPQSNEPYAFMLRKGDPEFKKLVDDTLSDVMKSGEITAIYDKWFIQPVPPKQVSFDLPMSDSLRALYANPNDHAYE
jgi:ABC-type amino acid transport substrate-binding protein